jgi:hypothetical protein
MLSYFFLSASQLRPCELESKAAGWSRAAVQEDTPDAGRLRDSITVEVKRLQQEAQPLNHANGKAEPVLSPYLQLVSSCIRRSSKPSAQGKAEPRETRYGRRESYAPCARLNNKQGYASHRRTKDFRTWLEHQGTRR